MKTSTDGHNRDNVVDLFTGRKFSDTHNKRFIRLSPELDGLELLYSNDSSEDTLFSLKLLFWGLRANGDVVGLVPWMGGIVAAPDIQDPLNGHFEGYFNPHLDEIFDEVPIHKVLELETSAEYYDYESESSEDILQELPDTIGTHAVLSSNGFQTITLTEVVSWRLYGDGTISGMLAAPDKVESTPVLPGDDCLYRAESRDSFRYFFQHQIANRLKSQDPEAIAAISTLMENKTDQDGKEPNATH